MLEKNTFIVGPIRKEGVIRLEVKKAYYLSINFAEMSNEIFAPKFRSFLSTSAAFDASSLSTTTTPIKPHYYSGTLNP